MSQDKKSSPVKVILSRDKLTASIFVPVQCDHVDREEIYRELNKEGIKFGVKNHEVELFATCPSREPVVVAEGTPPVPGRDGYMEVLFLQNSRNDPGSQTGAVDFRETSDIVSVEAGSQLVEVYPPVYGAEGFAVTGEVIQPPKPRVITIRAGKGVRLSEDGNRAFALVSGRPSIREAGLTRIINCDPVYIHNGDVDIKSGNLRFKGDVKISGNVCEAMEVQVSGNLEIQGLVTMASVASGGKLVVYGNVISSSLRAGIVIPGAKKLAFMFSDINSELSSLSNAIEQLRKMKVIDFAVVDYGKVILGLMDSRFKNLRPLVKNMQQYMAGRTDEMPGEIMEAVNCLSYFSGFKQLNQETFENIVEKVSGAIEMLTQSGTESGGGVLVRAALHSVIQSSGSVQVTGQGCVNTNITAGSNVFIKGSFKGGEIMCEGNADINELGSNLGAPPVVRVAAGSTIKVNKAYEGTILQVGKRRVTLTRETGSFRAKLSSDDHLEIF
ncbi:MAG: DUF342 domain-containing protein [Bacillota bacterium]